MQDERLGPCRCLLCRLNVVIRRKPIHGNLAYECPLSTTTSDVGKNLRGFYANYSKIKRRCRAIAKQLSNKLVVDTLRSIEIIRQATLRRESYPVSHSSEADRSPCLALNLRGAACVDEARASSTLPGLKIHPISMSRGCCSGGSPPTSPR